MFNFILFIFCTVLNSSILAQLVEGVNFDNYFEFVEEMPISNEILVWGVFYMDCYENTKLLVSDMMGKEVLLIGKDGHIQKQLNPEECHPGFHWRPIAGYFNSAGEIYVTNSSPWGFKFGSEGECIGPMHDTFLAPPTLTFANDGKIIGYYTAEDGNYLKVMDKDGVEIKRFGEFSEDYKNLIHRFEAGGVITDKYDNIYQVNINSPTVIKYNKQLEKIGEFEHYPDYYRQISEDISRDPMKMVNDIKTKLKGKTIVNDIFLIDEDKIALQLYHKSDFPNGLIIFDLEGNVLVEEDIRYNSKLLTAKDGYAYFVEQPEPDSNGNVPNPVILIYKLKL